MSITIQDLERDMIKYINLSKREDILISVNGKVVAKLSSPSKSRVQKMQSLFGIIPADITLEEAREEKLAKI